jgi:hypothetical protein
MKILFYSNRCKFSSELIKKLKDTNFSKDFQLIDIDKNQIPSKIKVVPTIIDPEYKDLLEGKKAFEYIFNKKYFDNPTNNLFLWKDKIVPNPDIKEDKLANNLNTSETIIFTDFNDLTKEIKNIEDNNKNEPVEIPKNKIRLSRKNLLLFKGKR